MFFWFISFVICIIEKWIVKKHMLYKIKCKMYYKFCKSLP